MHISMPGNQTQWGGMNQGLGSHDTTLEDIKHCFVPLKLFVQRYTAQESTC